MFFASVDFFIISILFSGDYNAPQRMHSVPLVSWQNVGRALFQLFLLSANYIPVTFQFRVVNCAAAVWSISVPVSHERIREDEDIEVLLFYFPILAQWKHTV